MRTYLTFLIPLVWFLSGCGSSGAPRYYIAFVNKTGQDLRGVYVYSGNKEIGGCGIVAKGGEATEGPETRPLPSEAEVRWEQGGTSHSVKVKLDGVVPQGLTRFNLYFIIKENGMVSTKAINFDDAAANAAITK